MSLIRLLASRVDREFVIFPGGGCDIAHARNLMVHEFLNHSGRDCDTLLMIDSDILFGPEHVERLLSWNLAVVGGIYPRKNSQELRWSVNGNVEKLDNGLWSVDELCTGFMAIKAALLQVMIAHFPETAYQIEDDRYRGETGHELFAMGVVNRRRLSEDYYFSWRVRQMGFGVYADPEVQLGHVGELDFLRLHSSRSSAG